MSQSKEFVILRYGTVMMCKLSYILPKGKKNTRYKTG